MEKDWAKETQKERNVKSPGGHHTSLRAELGSYGLWVSNLGVQTS